ncbi:MAG: hypothetical protein QXE80_03610 [Pyrobaculum sp.]
MKEVVYSFLGFIHQVPLRSTLAGISIYNGEPVRDLGFLVSEFDDLHGKLVKLTLSGQKSFQVVLPEGTVIFNSNAFSVMVTASGFYIFDATHSSVFAPYLICDGTNVIAGQYYFPKSMFPAAFSTVGTWTAAAVQDVPSAFLNTLKVVSKLPEDNFPFEENKARTLAYLAALGQNIARWLAMFCIRDDEEKISRLDSAISPIVSLLAKKLTRAQKIELVSKLDEEGLPAECAEPGLAFDTIIEVWLRSILWNSIFDFCTFHEPESRHQKAIPFDLGGRLYNQAMPRFF